MKITTEQLTTRNFNKRSAYGKFVTTFLEECPLVNQGELAAAWTMCREIQTTFPSMSVKDASLLTAACFRYRPYPRFMRAITGTDRES